MNTNLWQSLLQLPERLPGSHPLRPLISLGPGGQLGLPGLLGLRGLGQPLLGGLEALDLSALGLEEGRQLQGRQFGVPTDSDVNVFGEAESAGVGIDLLGRKKPC